MSKARPPIRSAFTLIELLVVIAIILIVVSLTIPAVNAAKRQAFRVRASHDIQMLCVAVEAYKQDMGYYPTVGMLGTSSSTGLGGGVYTSDSNGNNQGGGDAQPNDELYYALFAPIQGADGAMHGPYVSSGAFTVVTSGNTPCVHDHNGRRILYLPGHTGANWASPLTAVWDPYRGTSVPSSPQFADTIGNPLWRLPTSTQFSGYTYANPVPSGTGISDMPMADWRYILGNRGSYPGQDGTCQASRGETPAITGPYILWCSGPSHNEALYGGTGDTYGLLRDRSGNLIGTTPSAANGWHGYTTDDIMNFTFQP